MAKVQHKCPTCNKPVTLKSETTLFGSLKLLTYECGHSESVTGVQVTALDKDTLDITSLDGKKPFPYQLEGARFAEAANMRCLIADEMGLGKTIQAIMLMVAHPEARPFFAFVKAGLRVQWNKECVRWGDLMVQTIDEGQNAFFLPGMDGYIISQDSAWRIGTREIRTRDEHTGKTSKKRIKDATKLDVAEWAVKLGIKTILIDECQGIKNPDAERTKAIQKAANATAKEFLPSGDSVEKRQAQYVIGLSGTPIKNNAGEYGVILNIIRPDVVPDPEKFKYAHCDTYFDGYTTKVGGLKNPRAFHELTKDFIIRRERKDVLPDLPLIWRQYQYCELGDMVEAMYREEMQKYAEAYDGGFGGGGFELSGLAYLNKMRHLTGLAKVDPVVDFTEQFITSMPRERKIMLFVHHKDVGATLKYKLEKIAAEWPAEWGKGILQITSDMDAYQRDHAIGLFRSSDYRVMIGSTLACGEGLNLQFLADCIMVERQWNPANEEQAEARFPRPGQTADKINATYFVATGTVDEDFATIVEKKREIVTNTLNKDGAKVRWNETSLIKELMQITRERATKQWGVK